MFPGEDFDNIDVDLDVDINHKDKKKGGLSDDFEEDYLQDDIPIDDDDDDDIISDNYDNFDKTMTKSNKVGSPTPLVEGNSDVKNEVDEHVISMDHSDDIEESNKPEFVLPSDGPSPEDNKRHLQDEVDEDNFDDDEGMEMGMDGEDEIED